MFSDSKLRNKRHIQIARAKINLALHITGKIGDSYHTLDSLVAFPNVGDNLYFSKSKKMTLSVSGPFSSPDLESDDNIILKARKIMLSSGICVDINLEKNLPLASGIGGGSADAAATLRGLSRLLKKPLPSSEKILSLGADVPVCMSTSFQRMGGIGEKIVSLPSPPSMWMVLVNLLFHVPTKKIFNSLEVKNNSSLDFFEKFVSQDELFCYLVEQRNDLEPVACSHFPPLKVLLADLSNTTACELARMSGSGGTCFALYKNFNAANNAAKVMRRKYPRAWVKSVSCF